MVAHMTGKSATLALNSYTIEHIIHMLLTLSIGVICYFYIKYYLRTHHSLAIINAENSPAKNMFTIKSALVGTLIATFSGFGVVGLQKSKQNFPSGAYFSSICITIILFNFARKSIIRCFFMLQIRKVMLTKPLPFRECFQKGRVHPNLIEMVNIPGPSSLPVVIPLTRRPPLTVSANMPGAQRPPLTVSDDMSGTKRPPLAVSDNMSGAERPPLVISDDMSGAEKPPLTVSANMPGAERPPLAVSNNMSGAERPPLTVSANMSGAERPPLVVSDDMSGAERPLLTVSANMPGAERPPLAVSNDMSGAERPPL